MSAAVVKLPTAAPRKVNNSRWKEQRQANWEMKQQYADRFNHRYPWQRETAQIVDFMLDGGLTAERRLLMALLHRMDDEGYSDILREVSDTPKAVCLVKLSKPTVGLRASIEHEMTRRGL